MNTWKRQRQTLLPLLPVMAGAVLLCLLVLIAVRVGDIATARTTIDHPESVSVDDRTQINYPVIVTSSTPTVTIEVPADSLGRKFIGVGEGVVITVRVHGTTDPVTVDLGQRPAGSGSQGVVFYGDAGANTTASVTTSGGTNNIAQIRVRGEQSSAFQGDLDLTASVDGTEVTTERVAVLSITLDPPLGVFLVNDAPVTREVVTTPPTRDLDIDFRFFRATRDDMEVREFRETFRARGFCPLTVHQ